MADTEEPVIVRWYTPIRRFQRLIGKSPGGGYYPGGPYTILQFVGAASVFVTGQATTAIWGRFGWLTNNVLIFMVTLITLFGLGLVKSGGRNPISAGISIGTALSAPNNGEYDGHRVKTPRPVTVNHHVNALLIDPQDIVDALAAAAERAAERKTARPLAKTTQAATAAAVSAAPANPAPAPAAPAPVAEVAPVGHHAPAMSSVQRMLANMEEAS